MYCKLFASLYQGTLRGRSNEILVFTNLLAHTDREGRVDKHFKAIADETGLSMDEVKSAVEVLESPDPESRSKSNKGARLQRLDKHRAWGWQVVNYGKYREIRTEADRAEQNRLAQARFRERRKQGVSDQQSERVSNSKQSKPSVSACNTSKPMQKERERQREKQQGEGEAEATTTQRHTTRRRGAHAPLVCAAFDEFWTAYPKKEAKGNAESAWVEGDCAKHLPKILTTLRTFKTSPKWLEKGGQFIPHPATWLNRRGWEDELNGRRPDGTSPIRREDLPKVLNLGGNPNHE